MIFLPSANLLRVFNLYIHDQNNKFYNNLNGCNIIMFIIRSSNVMIGLKNSSQEGWFKTMKGHLVKKSPGDDFKENQFAV